MNTVLSSTVWQLGDGTTINFWLDNWLEEPLVKMLHIPDCVHKFLKLATVADFIQNTNWKLPASLILNFPDVAAIITQVVIPKFHDKDKLVWQSSAS